MQSAAWCSTVGPFIRVSLAHALPCPRSLQRSACCLGSRVDGINAKQHTAQDSVTVDLAAAIDVGL